MTGQSKTNIKLKSNKAWQKHKKKQLNSNLNTHRGASTAANKQRNHWTNSATNSTTGNAFRIKTNWGLNNNSKRQGQWRRQRQWKKKHKKHQQTHTSRANGVSWWRRSIKTTRLGFIFYDCPACNDETRTRCLWPIGFASQEPGGPRPRELVN